MGCEVSKMINANVFSAELISPMLNPTSRDPYCMSFSYFVHSNDRDNLAAYTKGANSGQRLKLWSAKGQLNSNWQRAAVEIQLKTEPFEVHLLKLSNIILIWSFITLLSVPLIIMVDCIFFITSSQSQCNIHFIRVMKRHIEAHWHNTNRKHSCHSKEQLEV